VTRAQLVQKIQELLRTDVDFGFFAAETGGIGDPAGVPQGETNGLSPKRIGKSSSA